VAGGAGTAQDYRPTVAVSIDACHDEGQGHNVGGVFAGEWLAYTVDVGKTGEYVFDLRLACPGYRFDSCRERFSNSLQVLDFRQLHQLGLREIAILTLCGSVLGQSPPESVLPAAPSPSSPFGCSRRGTSCPRRFGKYQ
jgi:hypothetical protein